jgi:acetyl esterase/lipase
MLLWPDLATPANQPPANQAPANQAPANQAPGAAGNASGDRPTLQFYRADSATPTAAVLVVPGGGYGGLADGHEGTEIARWLNSAGISAAICRYRHRNSGAGYGYPYPLLDAQRGVRMLRAQAASWNIDPNRIGVIGFSAGGHLVTSLSTTETLLPNAQDPLDSHSSRPDFAIVCYPVIAFGRPYTHQGSQRNLLGDDVPSARLEELSTDRRVSAETPPTFLWHTAEDPVVSVQNALVYYQALVAAGVPAELHIFERGRHGLGLARAAAEGPQLPSSHWPQLCLSWLKQHGFSE